MAIPTSRTREAASIHINTEKCTGCGRCVDVYGRTISPSDLFDLPPKDGAANYNQIISHACWAESIH